MSKMECNKRREKRMVVSDSDVHSQLFSAYVGDIIPGHTYFDKSMLMDDVTRKNMLASIPADGFSLRKILDYHRTVRTLCSHLSPKDIPYPGLFTSDHHWWDIVLSETMEPTQKKLIRDGYPYSIDSYHSFGYLIASMFCFFLALFPAKGVSTYMQETADPSLYMMIPTVVVATLCLILSVAMFVPVVRSSIWYHDRAKENTQRKMRREAKRILATPTCDFSDSDLFHAPWLNEVPVEDRKLLLSMCVDPRPVGTYTSMTLPYQKETMNSLYKTLVLILCEAPPDSDLYNDVLDVYTDITADYRNVCEAVESDESFNQVSAANIEKIIEKRTRTYTNMVQPIVSRLGEFRDREEQEKATRRAQLTARSQTGAENMASVVDAIPIMPLNPMIYQLTPVVDSRQFSTDNVTTGRGKVV